MVPFTNTRMQNLRGTLNQSVRLAMIALAYTNKTHMIKEDMCMTEPETQWERRSKALNTGKFQQAEVSRALSHLILGLNITEAKWSTVFSLTFFGLSLRRLELHIVFFSLVGKTGLNVQSKSIWQIACQISVIVAIYRKHPQTVGNFICEEKVPLMALLAY